MKKIKSLVLLIISAITFWDASAQVHKLDSNDVKLLINGAWVSTKDTNHTLYFMGSIMYVKAARSSAANSSVIQYKLSNKSCDRTLNAKKGTGFFIDSGNACAYILKLNDDSLSISFSGNMVQNYIRMKTKGK